LTTSGTNPNFIYIGIGNASEILNDRPRTAHSIMTRGDGYIWHNDVGLDGTPPGIVTGSVVAVEFDMTAKQAYFNIGGTWYGPYAFASLTGAVFAMVTLHTFADQMTVNFGQTAFAITPQSGYAAWDS
jgi:hypothetical protein